MSPSEKNINVKGNNIKIEGGIIKLWIKYNITIKF